MLNQNYTCCIFIRTDCEIWAVKTWVIVALETDISHFPSRSWKWHANFVFNVCAPFFVWLLCISAKKLQDEVDWEETAQMKRKRSEMEVLIGSYMFSVSYQMQESGGSSAHFILTHLRFTPFLSPRYKSGSDPDLCPPLSEDQCSSTDNVTHWQ